MSIAVGTQLVSSENDVRTLPIVNLPADARRVRIHCRGKRAARFFVRLPDGIQTFVAQYVDDTQQAISLIRLGGGTAYTRKPIMSIHDIELPMTPVIRSPKHDLAPAIENFIKERDQFFVRVANSAEPSLAEVQKLRQLNDVVRQMLDLKPGPNTGVLDPSRARLELLRVKVCATLISQCEIEIRGRNHPGIPVPLLLNAAIAASAP